jgi:polyhydroxybutyrate depolymerase
MIVLHGGLGSAESIETTTGMNQVADAGRFLVAYPNGIEGSGRMANRRTWNAGRCCGPARRRGVDDVAFIARMIDQIAVEHPTDPSRIYAVGLSNGAMMAYRLACEMPDRLAAVVAVAGPLAVESCSGSNPVAIYHIHGAADRNVPLEGGRGSAGLSRVSHRSLAESIEIVTATRGCSAPRTAEVSGGDRETHYDCRDGATVKLRVIAGADHGWPGAQGRGGAGIEASRFSASVEAWEFVSEFGGSRPAAEPKSNAAGSSHQSHEAR